MRYRPLEVVDLPVVIQLYRGMLAEAQAGKTIKYPQPSPETPTEMAAYLYAELTAPRHTCPHCTGDLGPKGFVSMVAVLGGTHIGGGIITGGRPVGFAFGEISARPIGSPKWVGHCRLIYVDPAHRAGRSLKKGRRVREGVGRQLLEYLIADALRKCPDLVLEGSYVPGSHGSRLWPRLGLHPYVTYCAFVDPTDGSPRDPRTLFAHRGGAHRGWHSGRPGGAGQQAKAPELGARRRGLVVSG